MQIQKKNKSCRKCIYSYHIPDGGLRCGNLESPYSRQFIDFNCLCKKYRRAVDETKH